MSVEMSSAHVMQDFIHHFTSRTYASLYLPFWKAPLKAPIHRVRSPLIITGPRGLFNTIWSFRMTTISKLSLIVILTGLLLGHYPDWTIAKSDSWLDYCWVSLWISSSCDQCNMYENQNENDFLSVSPWQLLLKFSQELFHFQTTHVNFQIFILLQRARHL